jgi:hypothetical protein
LKSQRFAFLACDQLPFLHQLKSCASHAFAHILQWNRLHLNQVRNCSELTHLHFSLLVCKQFIFHRRFAFQDNYVFSHCQFTTDKTRFCSDTFGAFARLSDLLSSLARSSAVPAVARRIQEMPKTLWLPRGN